MTHPEFIAAFKRGQLRVTVPPKPAASFVSRRMMLPLFLLPLFGLAVAFALAHAWLFAIAAFAAALVLRGAVRASAPGYILQRALASPDFYAAALAAGALSLELPAA